MHGTQQKEFQRVVLSRMTFSRLDILDHELIRMTLKRMTFSKADCSRMPLNRVLLSRKTPNVIIINDIFKIQISYLCKRLRMFDLILISLKGSLTHSNLA